MILIIWSLAIATSIALFLWLLLHQEDKITTTTISSNPIEEVRFEAEIPTMEIENESLESISINKDFVVNATFSTTISEEYLPHDALIIPLADSTILLATQEAVSAPAPVLAPESQQEPIAEIQPDEDEEDEYITPKIHSKNA